ncbi:amidase [Terrabacter sp. BE26]|uniref:amidase n=1 Tax=Terrabacter sp. BE26 TaxID=2898152 RepID=UPI0035BE5FD5
MRDAVATALAVRSSRESARESIAAALERIRAADPAVNAITWVNPDALAQAAALDARIAAGEDPGLLAGVPITVKDHIWLAGAPATNGSRALAAHVPDETAVCVERLIAAGAIVVAKTNNPEFCYRGTTSNDVYGTTRNPRDPSRTAGGSSGGAAASVAAEMVPLAIGTDGGGSIRIPSAFCGVYGLKPTFGLVPKMPGFRGWPTLSVDGPIGASVRDLALALAVMCGPSPADPLSFGGRGDVPSSLVDVSGSAALPLAGLRIAASEDLGIAQVDDDVRDRFRHAVQGLESAGAVVTWAAPAIEDPCPLWDAVALPEGYASEGPLLARFPELVGADAAAIIRAGDVPAARYLDAQHERGGFTRTWLSFFEDHDVLLTPAMPVVAFEADRLAPRSIAGEPVPESFDAWCALALPANLAGTPAVSLPIGTNEDGLPIGLQVTSARGTDWRLLRTCGAIDDVLTRLWPAEPGSSGLRTS